jgi:hypothetical protein
MKIDPKGEFATLIFMVRRAAIGVIVDLFIYIVAERIGLIKFSKRELTIYHGKAAMFGAITNGFVGKKIFELKEYLDLAVE